MNVPKLSFFSKFFKKKSKSEYFLSLVLRSEKTSAVVFEEVNGKVSVVGEHNEPFPASLEDSTEEELLSVIDKAVSTAERNLPPDVESHKTIFGVKQDWTEEGRIKKEYLLKLKKVSDELEFKPMGFLVIPEAISHLLQKEEGAPISAILAEIGKKNVTVSVIRGGKILETKSAPTQESEVLMVENILKHFTSASVLPTRIILFDGGKEKLQQEFISHKWSKDLAFLHVPQITNLPSNFDARAVLNGAATQMGFEVLEDSLNKAVKQDSVSADALDDAIGTQDKTLAEVASEFGFINEDVKKKDQPEKEDETETQIENAEEIPEKPKTAVDESVKSDNFDISEQFREIPEEVKINSSDKKPFPVNAALLGGAISGALGKIHFRSLLKGASGSRKKLLIVTAPIILILLILFVYLFARSATITLGIESKPVDKTENVTFSKSDPTSAKDNTINAQFLTVSEDGKLSTPATGKKQTGDKAKGTVTIFNNDTVGKTIPTGTVVTSSTNLNFLTDKPVTVASASGDIFSGTDPGKANVSVTAEKFGTNYNLPSGTKFTITGSSSVAAKNDNAFSGGTTKDIKVVSKADADKLLTDLEKQKESDAKAEIQKKASGDSVVLPNFISINFDKKSFSKNVGEEADSVSLTATISYKGVSYKRDEINSYAKDKLKSDDNKLTINNDSVQASAANLKEDGKNATAKLTIKAGLIPVIDDADLISQIKGKSVGDATTKLRTIPQVNNVNIKIFPPIPLLPNLLPFSSGKIKIVVNKNG